MESKEIAASEPGKYLALNHSTAEIQAVITENLAGQEVSERDLIRLKVPAGGAVSWEVEDPLEGVRSIKEICGIIVHKKQTRAYWPLSLDDSGDGSPPACSSPDAIVGYGKQWATSSDPDGDGEPKSLRCSDCPLSQFNSGKNGGQACQEKGQWYLLQQTGLLPIVATLPAMSLAPAKKYMLALAGAGIRFDQVATRLSLRKETKGSNSYAVVVPTMAHRLDPESAERARAYSTALRPVFDRLSGEATP